MGIQRDLANRWLHAWGSHLKLPLPTDLPQDFLPPEVKKAEEKKEAEKKDGVGKRDYNLDENDNPVYVGEGLGGYDHAQAIEISKIRSGRPKGGAGSSPGSMADEVTKIFRAFKETMGEKIVGKSYVVKPGESGAYQVEEVEPGKPMLVPSGAPPAKSMPSFYVDSDGAVKELAPGQPVVIIRDPPRAAAATSHYLVDQRTGEMRE